MDVCERVSLPIHLEELLGSCKEHSKLYVHSWESRYRGEKITELGPKYCFLFKAICAQTYPWRQFFKKCMLHLLSWNSSLALIRQH